LPHLSNSRVRNGDVKFSRVPPPPVSVWTSRADLLCMLSIRILVKLTALLALLAGAVLWLRSDYGPWSDESDVESVTAAVAGPIHSLSWLTGCWVHEEMGFRRDEQWMEPLGGTMIGMSRSVAGGETVEHELLRIETRDGPTGEGRLAFVALPSGQAEATFFQAELSDSMAVFEAPEHDFPQRITYRHVARGLAVATIEGEEEGITRVIEFPMTKTNCP
jgi:hypothetical protein